MHLLSGFKIAFVCALKTHTHRVEARGYGILTTPDYKQQPGSNMTLIILASITFIVMLVHRFDLMRITNKIEQKII